MHLLRRLRWQDWARVWRSAAAGTLALLLLSSAPLSAQKQKNQKQKDAKASITDKPVDEAGIAPLMPLSDSQAIEMMVSQMLAAWQIGDTDLLHSFYADEVLVVSGVWEPPLQGWQSYLSAYQAQRARTQAVRLERTNTFTKVQGDAAWCTYQWEFTGQVDGSQASAVGQTTLMLQKRAGKWLIVLNHTSIAPTPEKAPTAVGSQGPQSSKAAGGSPGA